MPFKNPHEILIQFAPHTITREIFKNYLPDNPVILEAGAHIGRNTIKFAQLWPAGTIYAVEPVPELYAALKKNTQELPNVHTENIALSNTPGTQKFFVSSGRSTALSSLKEPIRTAGLAAHPETTFSNIFVETTTIDLFAQKQHIQHIDFMWLDMQGSELEALRGSEHILDATTLLFIEASIEPRYQNEPLANEVASWLYQKNFEIVMRDQEKHGKINMLYVKKAYMILN